MPTSATINPNINPDERIALLRRLPYFAALDEQAMRALAASTLRRKYGAGQIVLIEGEPCAGLFVMQSGRAKIVRSSPEGREQILHFAGPGDWFNDVPVFDGGPNPATVETIEDSSVLIIERAAMLDMFSRQPQLAQAVVGVLAARCRQLVGMIEDLSLRTVTVRLAGLLLDQATQPAVSTLTRAQMAARLGTVREVVSRSLRDLEQDGLIQLDRGRIVITDRHRLAQRAGR